MFSYYEKGIKSKTHDNIISIDELIQLIRNPSQKELIEELRREAYKSDRYSQIKDILPCITPAGIFTNSRTPKEILRTSGYLFFDIDAPDINSDLAQYKAEISKVYKDYITLLGYSVGGRGLFFYIKVNGITPDNYTSVYEYYKNSVFANLKIDNNAKGINRAQILTYDPDLYINKEVSLNIPSDLIINNKENRTFNIKISKERCYTLNVHFLPIDEVLAKMKQQTEVIVSDTLFEINPIDYLKLYIPKTIEDGNKHKTFRALTEAVLFLNPDIDLLSIQSFINYVNQNHTTLPMMIKEMVRTVEYTYNQIKETGEIHISLKAKTLHFNKDCGLSSSQKRIIANKVNALIQKFKSVALMDIAKKELTNEEVNITKTTVSIRTGLCYKTVSRHWDTTLIEIMKQINAYNRTINNEA